MEWISNALVIAFGILSVMLFGTILSRGRITLIEPRKWILITELVASFGIIIIGVIGLINYLLGG